MSERKPPTPTEIDDMEDRIGSVEPLDFSSKHDERQGYAGDRRPESELRDEFPPERVREAGMTSGETLDDAPTMDDLAPETLTPEDGARSAHERGHGLPADQDLRTVDADHIGAGGGLDEEEEALLEPLDGQPWNKADDLGVDEKDDEEEDEEEGNVLSDEELRGPGPLDSGPHRES